MDRTLTPAEKAAKLYKSFKERDVQLSDVYKRTMRILEEHLVRHEKRMFEGLGYSEFNPDLAKSAEGLARVIEKLTRLHLARLKESDKVVVTMTLDDQIEWCISFIQDLPPGFRRDFLSRLEGAMSIRCERRKPDGRPPEGWIHPLDRN